MTKLERLEVDRLNGEAQEDTSGASDGVTPVPTPEDASEGKGEPRKLDYEDPSTDYEMTELQKLKN